MTDEAFAWPPSTYWTTGSDVWSKPESVVEVVPLEEKVFLVAGKRIMRYQIPRVPVEPGSVFVSGNLHSTKDGQLIDDKGQAVGTVNFDTGFFEIDIDLSPGLMSRVVEFLYPRRS